MANDKFSVEVAYATPERQVIFSVCVCDNTTLATAIQASGILTQFPEIDLNQNTVGVFSKQAKLNDVVKAGDRIEILSMPNFKSWNTCKPTHSNLLIGVTILPYHPLALNTVRSSSSLSLAVIGRALA